jgi:hypothetical protein
VAPPLPAAQALKEKSDNTANKKITVEANISRPKNLVYMGSSSFPGLPLVGLKNPLSTTFSQLISTYIFRRQYPVFCSAAQRRHR